MSFSRFFLGSCTFCLTIILLSGCRVQPLYNGVLTDNDSSTNILSSLRIEPAKTRIAQRVRNELIFSLRGGNDSTLGTMTVELDIESEDQEHSVLTGVRGATAAHVEINVIYRLVEGDNVLASGERRALAGYDLTPQNFANQRARHDAENRAARTAARLIRLALAQNLIDLKKE